ncbi:MAG: 30S ribosomal protein S14 [Pseudomonadota bacterium]
MAKMSAVERNKKRQRLVTRYAAKRAALKAIADDKSVSAEDRFNAYQKLSKLPRNASPTRLHNRCEVTGRPKAYYRRFKVSRIALRELASSGQIPGMVKSSW